MIIPGICSVTLKHLSPEEVIAFAVNTGLKSIEWWADGHVLPADIARAEEIGRHTRQADLSVSSYGSYYRLGISDPGGAALRESPCRCNSLGRPDHPRMGRQQEP